MGIGFASGHSSGSRPNAVLAKSMDPAESTRLERQNRGTHATSRISSLEFGDYCDVRSMAVQQIRRRRRCPWNGGWIGRSKLKEIIVCRVAGFDLAGLRRRTVTRECGVGVELVWSETRAASK